MQMAMSISNSKKNASSHINSTISMTAEETRRIMCSTILTNDNIKNGNHKDVDRNRLESFQRMLDNATLKINEASEKRSNSSNDKQLAAAISASSTAKTAQVQAQDARKYLMRIKEELSDENRRKFNVLLRNYRAREISISDLVPELKEIIGFNQNLLGEFKQFLPPKHQKIFDTLVTTIDNNKSNNNNNNNNGDGDDSHSKPLNEKENDETGKSQNVELSAKALELIYGKNNSSLSVPEEKKCPYCKEKLKAPFKAKCGHVCCFICWKSWLDRCLECPLCRRRTRLSHLVKIYQ